MAHQTITLNTSWFTRASNRLLWRPPTPGERVQIDAELLPSGVTERYFSNFLLEINAGSVSSPHRIRMDLTDSNSSGGFGGGVGSNLSNNFNTDGEIGIRYKTHLWILDNESVSDDVTEPFLWSLSGDAGVELSDFVRSVNDGLTAVDAELIIWDGQGTSPFPAAPSQRDGYAEITLSGSTSYTREQPTFTNRVSRLRWDWDSGLPQIPASLVNGNAATGIEHIEVNLSGSSAYFELDTSGSDLSNGFENGGEIRLEFANHTIHIDNLVGFGTSSADTSDPYRWDGGSHQNIRDMVAAAPATDSGDAVLKLWDGSGDNPFIHHDNKIFIGAQAESKRYIGDRRVLSVYIGTNKL